MASAYPTTTGPFNYQYEDIVDDDDVETFMYEENKIIPVTNPLAAVVDDKLLQNTKSLISSTLRSNATSTNLDGVNLDKEHHNFESIMSQRTAETNEFRLAIICIGLTLISTGILANLFFKLMLVCRKGKRQTCTTLTMISMCLAYTIFLILYSLKLSVYLSGDNIAKFHIYDTIDNWVYGGFLCSLMSGMPLCCKLISRLSILALVAKRVLNIVVCDCKEEICAEFNCKNDELSEEINEQTKLKANNGIEGFMNKG